MPSSQCTKSVGALPSAGGQKKSSSIMETVDWTEQMFGTIVLSVMVDADKSVQRLMRSGKKQATVERLGK
jgi:hypothetical protein